MNRIQKRRLYYVIFFIVGLAVAASLVFYALRQNMNVFLTPDQLAHTHHNTQSHFRLGGMVKKESIRHQKKDLDVTFVVTDFKQEVTVHYHGVLPDLFREGKGVIAEGQLDQHGEFQASMILAKHDENYMPRYKSTSTA